MKYFPAYNTTITEELSKTPTSISGYEDVQVAHKMDYRFSKRLKVQLKGSYYMLNKYDFQADNIFEKSEDYTYGGSIDYTISDKSSLVASVHTDHYNRYDKYELKSGRRLEYKTILSSPVSYIALRRSINRPLREDWNITENHYSVINLKPV